MQSSVEVVDDGRKKTEIVLSVMAFVFLAGFLTIAIFLRRRFGSLRHNLVIYEN
jgi:hypothetical protein